MNITPRRRTLRDEEAERPGLTGLLPPPPVPDLPPDRARRLKEALLREAAAAEPPRTRVPRAVRPRLIRYMAPAVACALAIGGAVAVDLRDAPGPTTPVEGGAPEATRLLNRIALAAAKDPRPAVRSEQFVYIESRVAYGAQSAAGGPVTMAAVHTRQVWLSVDGSRPGLLREGGAPDMPLSVPDSGGGSLAYPTHRYVASLPTDPDALLRLIRSETRGDAGRTPSPDADQRAFTAIGDLVAETWAPPRVCAALYKAAARIPGVTVIPAATDAAGREGVAVARTAHGRQTQWIFDRTTYAFLGERTVLTETGEAGPAGTVVGISAVLTKAAVDGAGDKPSTASTKG
ncbi:CU044_5270 family protein [Streptomyces coeruleoprunus]|uniref:CU044_5270 family protein n=1 Tax=Streptomyces coeruleoprunus TaxID=285563 RepID=A0ABV9X7R6_9ACTN